MPAMRTADQLAQMDAESLRSLVAKLITEVTDIRRDNTLKQLKIGQLTRRWRS